MAAPRIPTDLLPAERTPTRRTNSTNGARPTPERPRLGPELDYFAPQEGLRAGGLLPPGLHVAPFRSFDGLPMLVAIGAGHELLNVVEVAPTTGPSSDLMILLPRLAGDAETAEQGVLVQAGKRLLTGFPDESLYETTSHTLVPRGLSVVPWRPAVLPDGVAYVGVDLFHRLVFYREARTDECPETIAREFQRALLASESITRNKSGDAAHEAVWRSWHAYAENSTDREDLALLESLGARGAFVAQYTREVESGEAARQWRRRQEAQGRSQGEAA